MACLAVLVAAHLVGGAAHRATPRLATLAVVVLAAVLGWASAALLGARCVRRLGGITGDVLGAAAEVAFTVCLVVLALGWVG
jgi:adenosylcobinamide-GDP ribazoletransferase